MFDQINPYILNDIPEIKISYHPYYNTSEKRYVFNSKRSYKLFSSMWNRDTINLHEEILVAFLNHNHQVIGVRYHSKGTAIATTIDIRQILSVGLKSNAKGMIIAHNHPEGTAHPSEADKEMTIQLDKASALCGMKLLDHIILSPDEDYYSFSDSGIIKGYAIDKLITKQALDTSLET